MPLDVVEYEDGARSGRQRRDGGFEVEAVVDGGRVAGRVVVERVFAAKPIGPPLFPDDVDENAGEPGPE